MAAGSGKEVGAQVAQAASALAPGSTHPFYLLKILTGCAAMGHSSMQLTTWVASNALPRLKDTHPNVQQDLVRNLSSMEGAQGLPPVRALKAAVRD